MKSRRKLIDEAVWKAAETSARRNSEFEARTPMDALRRWDSLSREPDYRDRYGMFGALVRDVRKYFKAASKNAT